MLRLYKINFKQDNARFLRNILSDSKSCQCLNFSELRGVKQHINKIFNVIFNLQKGNILLNDKALATYLRQKIAQTLAYVTQQTEMGGLTLFNRVWLMLNLQPLML